jgi:hypothetical protein
LIMVIPVSKPAIRQPQAGPVFRKGLHIWVWFINHS